MARGEERVLRRRIRSVESTKKITRAMELIAAARIGRAQQAIAAARPYVSKMAEVLEHLAATPDATNHLMFRASVPSRRTVVVFVTADRGLAGGYNIAVIREVERVLAELRAEDTEAPLFPIGRKGLAYFRYRRQPLLGSLTGASDRPSYEDARRVVAELLPAFLAGDVDQIELVYTRFITLGSQQVRSVRLVPIEKPMIEPGTFQTSYEFEPEPAAILDRLLPTWLEAQIHAAMLDAAASEHAYRQRAMKAATDNAEELIKTLRRHMNRVRQDSITTEIMEIVGGAEALRQSHPGRELENA
jgi:F-type H+-transporting ATPase subunit gamma